MDKGAQEKIRDILRRYGNFMDGYDADGDALDIDETVEAIKALIEPLIEEAAEQKDLGFNSLSEFIIAKDAECGRRVEEAKKQERERINNWALSLCVSFNLPEQGLPTILFLSRHTKYPSQNSLPLRASISACFLPAENGKLIWHWQPTNFLSNRALTSMAE